MTRKERIKQMAERLARKKYPGDTFDEISPMSREEVITNHMDYAEECVEAQIESVKDYMQSPLPLDQFFRHNGYKEDNEGKPLSMR